MKTAALLVYPDEFMVVGHMVWGKWASFSLASVRKINSDTENSSLLFLLCKQTENERNQPRMDKHRIILSTPPFVDPPQVLRLHHQKLWSKWHHVFWVVVMKMV